MSVVFPQSASLTLRLITGSALTYQQMDDNWVALRNVDQEIINVIEGAAYTGSSNTFTEPQLFLNNVGITGSLMANWAEFAGQITSLFPGVGFNGTASWAMNTVGGGGGGVGTLQQVTTLGNTTNVGINVTNGNLIVKGINVSASIADLYTGSISSSYSLTSSFASTASYINVTGSGVLINWNGSQLQLTASGGTTSTDTLQTVTTRGNRTSASIFITGSLTNGLNVRTIGTYSHAEGRNSSTDGNYSHAEGYQTTAGGIYSHTEGYRAVAEGTGSHAEGYQTIAGGNYSHAEGDITWAIGFGSHAEGYLTTASGSYSHAEGDTTIAVGDQSHAEGWNTTAIGTYSHAEGYYNTAIGPYSHAEGGYSNQIEGTWAIGTGSHAEGIRNTAKGHYSHVEGQYNLVESWGSHVEGFKNTAALYSDESHAEGSSTTTVGPGSHTEGFETTTKGYYSHAEGLGTITNAYYQHVEGKYNIEDTNALWIVGDGTNNANRHNLISASVGKIDIDGTLFANKITGSLFGTASTSATASYLNPLNQNIILTGSLNILGDINAINLYVQTITSSTEYISGSTIFGSLQSNTHQFTGSVNITGSLTSPNITGSLFGTASWAISASNALTASFLLGSVATASYALNLSSSVYSKEIHVSSGSGNDTTGNGTLLNPYKTVTKAFSVVGSTGEAIILHPGVYTESPTLTALNVTVTSVNTGGGITQINGTLTISGTSSSTRLVGVRATNLTKTAAGQLYLQNCQVPGLFTNSGTGYCEIIDTDCQGTGVSVTGASIMVFDGGKQNGINVNNASAVVTVKNSFTCVAPSVTNGTLAFFDSIVYAATNGGNALTSVGTAQFVNTSFYNPNGTVAKISATGAYGYQNSTFNITGSTLSGLSLNNTAQFQSITASNGANTVGLFGTASWAVSSSRAVTSLTASYVATASYALSSSYITNNNLAVLSVYSTQDQTLPASQQTTMSFNNALIEDLTGLRRTGSLNDQILIKETGYYNFQFSAQVTDTGNGTFYVWFAKNGTNIPDSNTSQAIKANEPGVLALNFVDYFVANDVVELRWAGSNSAMTLDYIASPPYGPAIPSVILTVTQIK